MRKNLQQNNEAGFYLVYTVFISMIVCTILLSAIVAYRLNVTETHKLLDLTRKETIIQMAKESFKQDFLHNEAKDGKIIYNYPDGEVEVLYEKMEEGIWKLVLTITTKQKNEYTAYYLLPISPDD